MALAKYAYTPTKLVTGNLRMFICEYGTAPTAYTLTSGEITAVTGGATSFMEVGFELDSLEWTSEMPEASNNEVYNNKITATLAHPCAANNTFFTALSLARLLGVQVIIADEVGKCYLFGYTAVEGKRRGMNRLSTKYESGKEPGEANKGVESFTLSGKSGYPVLPFNSVLSASIIDGTAAFCNYNT